MTLQTGGETAYDIYKVRRYTSNEMLYECTNRYKDRTILVVENIIYSKCIV